MRPGGHYVGKHVLFQSFAFPLLAAAERKERVMVQSRLF